MNDPLEREIPMKLEDARDKIDALDVQITDLFAERMAMAGIIAGQKKKEGLGIYNPLREQQVLEKVQQQHKELASYTSRLYRTIFALSRAYQRQYGQADSPVRDLVAEMKAQGQSRLPERAVVALPGGEGNLPQGLLEHVCKAELVYRDTVASVLQEVEDGVYSFGLLPLYSTPQETMKKVHRGLLEKECYIVAGTKPSIKSTPWSKKEAPAHEQNQDPQYIVIAANPLLYPGANQLSFLVHTPHWPGDVFEVISRFAALDKTFAKLDTYTVSEEDGSYSLYVEMEASVMDPQVVDMLEAVEQSCEEFRFLGNYCLL